MPPSILPGRGCTSCRPSTHSSISASACICSSATSTASRPTSPRTSGGSAISPSRCSSGTKSPPSSISRLTASGASSWCSAGPGSAIARAPRAGGGSKKHCIASSASSSPAERSVLYDGATGPQLMKKLLLLLLFAWGSACGQTYPAKPVKLIVTYPPGGSSDLMARVFGAKLSELWGQQVIVESKPGAAGSIGMDYAAKQPADGYSFVIGNSGPVAINPLLSSVPYNIEKDFIPVSLISPGPNVLVVRADSPHKSLADVISFARENPGMLNYGTSGPGSISHLSSEMLKSLTRVQAVEVPYKGGVLAVQDLLGDQIHFIFSDTLPAMQHIRAGKLRALCITGAEPFALLPELAPCQAAAPGLVAVNWWGVLMPAGTPRSIVAKLNGDTVKALADADVRKKFADLGVEAVSSTPEQFAAFIRAEMDKYGKLIKEANIKVNP